ncbi:hypothetical protein [Pseudomonas sp. MYb330]|uniref:hypothetical protein n=1 Tax=unclassified Pseudomonas TaxID=196821 RepID=UPI00403F3205
MLEQEQLPDSLIDLVLHLFITVLDGRNTAVTNGVQRAWATPHAPKVTTSGTQPQQVPGRMEPEVRRNALAAYSFLG